MTIAEVQKQYWENWGSNLIDLNGRCVVERNECEKPIPDRGSSESEYQQGVPIMG